jgi:hypothetical protein
LHNHSAELVLKHCLDDLAEVGAMRQLGWIDLPASEVARRFFSLPLDT